MSEFFEMDQFSGIRTDTAWDEASQQMTLIRTADVEPVLDYSKEMAADSSVSQRGIKQGWWRYASLPPIVILQMRAKGINVFDQNDQARMFAEINTHYPHLKNTTGNEGGREKIVVG
jgi:hypothetical protein